MFGRPLFIIRYASSKAYCIAEILFSYLYNHKTKKKKVSDWGVCYIIVYIFCSDQNSRQQYLMSFAPDAHTSARTTWLYIKNGGQFFSKLKMLNFKKDLHRLRR